MTASRHIAIRAKVAALLKASPALAGGLVFQNRDLRLPEGVASQVHVSYETSSAERPAMLGSPLEWTTTIAIEVRARASLTGAGLPAEDVADAIWVDAFARVMADQSLGGLVQDLDPGAVDVSDAQADTGLCSLTWRFTVLHSTANNTIAAP